MVTLEDAKRNMEEAQKLLAKWQTEALACKPNKIAHWEQCMIVQNDVVNFWATQIAELKK